MFICSLRQCSYVMASNERLPVEVKARALHWAGKASLVTADVRPFVILYEVPRSRFEMSMLLDRFFRLFALHCSL